MEDRPPRLEIEAFNVEEAPIAGLHYHRDAPTARHVADLDLDVERIAFLDHAVEAVYEFARRGLGDALFVGQNAQVRVDFGNSAGGDDGLVQTEIEERCWNAIEIRQRHVVIVGQAKLTAETLHGQQVGDAVADAQAHHAEAKTPQAGLLLGGDLVAVPVQAHSGE